MTFIDVTPQEDIDRNRQIAEAMQMQAMQFRPVLSPLQGLSQLAQSGVAALLQIRAGRQQKERDEARQQALASLMPPTSPLSPGPPALPGAPGPVAPGGPGLPALLQIAGQFPELSGAVNPLIQARMAPTGFTDIADPTTLGLPAGTIAQRGPRGEINVVSRPESDVVSPEREAQLMRLAEARREPGFRFETRTDPVTGETITVVARGVMPEPVSKTTASKLEQGITQATERLDRISRIRENFDESLLELPTQLRNTALTAIDKLGVPLSREQRQEINRATRFQTATISNLNRTLNELSGAAISPAEAKRLEGELPNIGDSPEQFIAKVQQVEESIQAAIRRNQQLLEGGVRNLEFTRSGEVKDAPELETFMLLEEERPVEAGMVPSEEVPPPPPGFRIVE